MSAAGLLALALLAPGPWWLPPRPLDPAAATARVGADEAGRRALISADADFDARVPRPAFAAERGPRLAIDEAHRNLHTAGGTYARLADLARSDGFRVSAFAAPITAAALADVDVLAVANARTADPAVPDGAAMTAAEEAALAEWVRGGGALFLVTDHPPLAAPVTALAARFGVAVLGGHAKDAAHADPVLGGVFVLVFDAAAGLLGDHAILRGRDETERVRRVVTFGGTALGWMAPAERPAAFGRGVRLLPFAASARRVASSTDAEPDSGEPIPEGAQAVALEFGAGRVVVAAEAGVFSAQVLRGEAIRAQLGRDEVRIGMTRADSDNRQFALNVLRWLGRAL